MFKENDDMRPAATPERVLAICKLVEYGNGSYSTSDLCKLCTLEEQGEKNNEAINKSIEAAIELEFIEKSGDKNKLNSDDTYKLTIDKTNLESSVAFRKAVSSVVFNKKKSTFFLLTSWFINHSEDVLGITKFIDLAAKVTKADDGIPYINENDILGWRFWMRYLGIAYQYNSRLFIPNKDSNKKQDKNKQDNESQYSSTLIQNMKTRLEDAFELGKVPNNTRMTCIQFMSWIKANLPEAAEACAKGRLPLALSNGLRCLVMEKKIELISTRDAERISLYPIEGIEPNDFSEIIIRRYGV